MRLWLSLGCATALVAVAACNRSEEQAPPPENRTTENAADAGSGTVDVARLMHDRHERYEEIGDAMKGISTQLKSDAPSLEAIRRHSALIARYAPQVVSWFPAGSGPETGHKTRAKAEIWQDFDAFRQRAREFETQAARFNQAAQGTDLGAIRAAQRDLGNSCKECHDRFRGPEIEH